MDITIIGTGNMARGIATRALAGGNRVTLLGTSIEKAQALAGELSGDVRAGQAGDPPAGDVVVLAVWYQAVDEVLRRYEGQLDGKVVVDITNPVDTETYAPLTSRPAQSPRRSPPASRAPRSSRRSTRHSPARSSPARSPASSLTSCSPPMTRRPRKWSAGSPPTAACDRSTRGRWPSRTTLRRSATSIWPSSPRWARTTAAHSRSSPKSRAPEVSLSRGGGRVRLCPSLPRDTVCAWAARLLIAVGGAAESLEHLPFGVRLLIDAADEITVIVER